MKSRSLCNERRRLTVDCSVSHMLPLAFEIEFFLFSVRADGSSQCLWPTFLNAGGLSPSVTDCLFFYSLLESSAADGRRRHHLRLLLVPQDELFGAGHVLVS